MSYGMRCMATMELKIARALKKVKTILDNARQPKIPKDVAHTYDDKYLLAELCTKSAIAAQLNNLSVLGLTMPQLTMMCGWAKAGKSVTFRFTTESSCAFVREEKREQESATKYVKETTGIMGKSTETHKVVTTITEYFYKFDCKWAVTAYAGPDPTIGAIAIRSRAFSLEEKQLRKRAERPENMSKTLEVNISWLLQCFDPAVKQWQFRINRDNETCRTPRRNDDVQNALDFFGRMQKWFDNIRIVFADIDIRKSKRTWKWNKHGQYLEGIKDAAKGCFDVVAAVFMMEDPPAGSTPRAGTLFSAADFGKFMLEHQRSLREALASLDKQYPADGDAAVADADVPAAGTMVAATTAPPGVTTDAAPPGVMIDDESAKDKVVTASEASLLLAFHICLDTSTTYHDAVRCLEEMLYSQVAKAIGKEVSPADFTEYMDYHYSRLFKEEFRPRPFCFAIRRPNRFPEGTLSIEQSAASSSASNTAQPIRTFVGKAAPAPMKFALNAAAEVTFNGDRFLHCTVLHKFSHGQGPQLSLVARARQFSSFVLLVGKIAAKDKFDPTSAIIIRNKDDLKIPLLMETIPAAKEFRDSIQSLSPEQQRFCKDFRGMQLASTMFGVVIVQIKPQLERVLNLPDGSLTKEIALSEGLAELFIEYQIPPDLLSFDGLAATPQADKVAAVKAHYAAVQKIIADKKAQELKLAEDKAKKEQAAAFGTSQAIPNPFLSFAGPRPPPSCAVFGGGFMGGAPSGFMGGPPPSSPFKQFESNATAEFKQCESAAAKPSPPPGMMKHEAMKHETMKHETMKRAPKAPEPTKVAQEERLDIVGAEDGTAAGGTLDMTKLPGVLDKRFERFDKDGELRPTIIKPGSRWSLSSKAGLLSDAVTKSLGSVGQKTKRNAAFDLLDALTRSGAVEVEHASLHVVLAATHCFEKTLMATVVEKNENPIEKVERSLLMMATVVTAKPVQALVEPAQLKRLGTLARSAKMIADIA